LPLGPEHAVVEGAKQGHLSQHPQEHGVIKARIPAAGRQIIIAENADQPVGEPVNVPGLSGLVRHGDRIWRWDIEEIVVHWVARTERRCGNVKGEPGVVGYARAVFLTRCHKHPPSTSGVPAYSNPAWSGNHKRPRATLGFALPRRCLLTAKKAAVTTGGLRQLR